MLYDIHKLRWDERLLRRFRFRHRCSRRCAIPPRSTVHATFRACRCRLRASRETSRRRCSGSAASSRATPRTPYGTGCFLLMNTGETAMESEHGLVTTIAVGLDGRVAVCTRRLDFCRRRGHSVAARRAALCQRSARRGIFCIQGARTRAAVYRGTCLYGTRRAALGHVRKRRTRRASRAAQNRSTSSEPRRSRLRTSPMIWSTRWKRTPV